MALTFPQEIVPLGTQKREDTVSVSHKRRPLDPHYVSVNESNLHEYLSLKQKFETLRDIPGWFSNRTGTSFDDGKARENNWTLLPVPNLSLCHWSSQLFDLRAPSSNDVPVLLLNQPTDHSSWPSSSEFGYYIGETMPLLISIPPIKWTHSI